MEGVIDLIERFGDQIEAGCEDLDRIVIQIGRQLDGLEEKMRRGLDDDIWAAFAEVEKMIGEAAARARGPVRRALPQGRPRIGAGPCYLTRLSVAITMVSDNESQNGSPIMETGELIDFALRLEEDIEKMCVKLDRMLIEINRRIFELDTKLRAGNNVGEDIWREFEETGQMIRECISLARRVSKAITTRRALVGYLREVSGKRFRPFPIQLGSGISNIKSPIPIVRDVSERFHKLLAETMAGAIQSTQNVNGAS